MVTSEACHSSTAVAAETKSKYKI